MNPASPTTEMVLSPTMQAALNVVRNHGGRLERWPGGFWTYHGCLRQPHTGYPTWSIGTTTVQALVKRGALQYVEWKENSSGRFPITAEITAPK